ncbi:ATP-binding protein [Paenochrobactrum sp. BZR 588]|uniref:ATP-binding protein n=1 Tax=Paenochrobactrum TaxID=999488 RepID=UPI0035BBEA50
MSSIRKRLITILIGTTCLVWLFAVGWIYLSTQAEVKKVLDARLMESAHMVNSLLTDRRVEVGDEGGIGQFTPKPIPDFPNYDRQLFCQIWSLDGNLVGRSASAPKDMLTKTSNGFSNTVVSGSTWRVYTIENTQLGMRIMVGDNMSVRNSLVRDVITGLLLPALLIFPFLAGLIWISVRRGLLPLSTLASTLSKRSADDLSPLEESNLPSEIAPAVNALNGLFNRVEEAREREKSFAIFAAHELKTPLAGLKTQAHIAMNSKDEHVRDNAMRQISTGVERTTRLVKQLLDLASLETDEEPVKPTKEYAGKLMHLIAQDLRLLTQPKKIIIQIDEPCENLKIKDAQLFTLALRNILENAVNHSPEGAKIYCSCKREADKVSIIVEDEGPGIPADELPHISERFFRGRYKSENGSGLGLAIVQAAAKRMHATVHFINREASGVKVLLEMPIIH